MNVEDIPVDSFEEGEYYIVEIVVDSVSVEGVDCCIFDDEVTAYIDGAEVTGWYNSVTTNNDNTVTIRYEFRRPASAPEAPVGATVSGTITSFGSSGANLNLQLIPSGSQEPVCETTTGENNDNFDFSGVEAGSYIVRVSKENHVTRDYEVTVGEDPVNLDVKLHLVGDINGDGNINVADYMPVLAHAKGVSDLSGYSKLCGDITEDDNINVADYMPILAHAKGISQLWQ